jgi:hypothetical protein
MPYRVTKPPEKGGFGYIHDSGIGYSKWFRKGMAGTTGLEPAASAVTGQRSNQLNYVPKPLVWTGGQ